MFYNIKIAYLCAVFFMVLDLRLTMKIGCRDDNLFLFYRVAFSDQMIFSNIFPQRCRLNSLFYTIFFQ